MQLSSKWKFIVYRTICLVNGKQYIGKHKTIDLDDGYLGSGRLLNSAIKKHGQEKFRREIIATFETEDEMNSLEAELVTEEFCARDDNYNLCPGGKGGWGFVNANVRTPEMIKRVATQGAMAKNEKHGISCLHVQEVREKIGASLRRRLREDNWWVGRKHSEETKEKMRRSHNSKSHPRGPRGPYKKRIPLGSSTLRAPVA